MKVSVIKDPPPKGSIRVGNGTKLERLNGAVNGQVLTADDTKPLGVEWKTPTGGQVQWGDVQNKPLVFPPEAHTHGYEPANANIQSHINSAHAPANAQKNSDITKAEIETKLTGEISSHTHAGGGSDPWTYIRLANDFNTTSNVAQNVTGMFLTPQANQRYEIEGQLMLKTNTATVNPRIGCSWSTGLTDGVAYFQLAQSATAIMMANGNMNAAILTAVGGLPNNSQSWPAQFQGLIIAGVNPSGNWQLQLASETNGTQVTIKAGSFLKYRLIP